MITAEKCPFKTKAQDFFLNSFKEKAIMTFKPPQAWRAASGPRALCLTSK